MIILVAAMSRGRVIGKGGALPWGHGRMRHDQARYRQMVKGKTIVLGSGTYHPKDDYVKNAECVFLMTSQDVEKTDKLTPLNSIKPILELGRGKDVYILGGAMVFKEFMPHADKLELTYIDADYKGDRFFPEFAESDWEIAKEEAYPADEDNIHSYKFITLIREP